MTEQNEEAVRGMLDDCINVLTISKERGGPGFNDWERNFILDVDEHFERARKKYGSAFLTEKQFDKLEALWNRI